jgi:hypothetical protein
MCHRDRIKVDRATELAKRRKLSINSWQVFEIYGRDAIVFVPWALSTGILTICRVDWRLSNRALEVIDVRILWNQIMTRLNLNSSILRRVWGNGLSRRRCTRRQMGSQHVIEIITFWLRQRNAITGVVSIAPMANNATFNTQKAHVTSVLESAVDERISGLLWVKSSDLRRWMSKWFGSTLVTLRGGVLLRLILLLLHLLRRVLRSLNSARTMGA